MYFIHCKITFTASAHAKELAWLTSMKSN